MAVIQLDRKFYPSTLKTKADELLPRAAEALSALREKTCVGSEWTGWFDYPKARGFALASEVSRYVDGLDVPYDLVVVIGIGGSYLGTRAVGDALTHTYAGLVDVTASGARPMLAYAGHHLSEIGLIELLDLLEQTQPIVNVISKSGTTTEPSVAFRVIRKYMEKRFGKAEAARRIVATTDPEKGALRRLADEVGYQTFEVPSDIGGRYSVLTAVGLVPLALAGFDIHDLMAGADRVFSELTALRGGEDHPVLSYAASRMAAYDAGKRIELLSYAEPKLGNFVEWWKQLFGESEGKDGKGLFPAGLAFTTDLHSLGQFAQEGTRNLLETFLWFDGVKGTAGGEVERRLRVPHADSNADELGYLENRPIADINEAAFIGTKVAHFDGDVPCLELRAGRLEEASIGALFAFFETACAVSGSLLGVHPFDQPGVEAYKKNLFGLLRKPGFEELGAALRKRL